MAETLNSSGWVTYLRVSDEEKQTPERSFAMQRQHIQEQLIRTSDIPFNHEYCDMLTDTNPNRTDYQKLLADAEAGRFSHLSLYRADRFGRLFISGKISEETYTQLRAEWQDNIRSAQTKLVEAERNTNAVLVDLDMALILLANVSILYERLDDKAKANLLKILAKRIIINSDGRIIDQELHSPFTYLRSIAESIENTSNSYRDSEQVRLGALAKQPHSRLFSI